MDAHTELARRLRDLARDLDEASLEVEELGPAEESGALCPQCRGDSVVEPPWMTIARGQLGVQEVGGAEDHPVIRKMHGATRGGQSPDSVPWCASAVNYWLQLAGIKGTRTKRARDFEGWGTKLDTLQYGCVVTFWRGSPKSGAGHVAFGVGEANDLVWVLGGNQSSERSRLGEVCIKPYPLKQCTGYWWPSGS